MNENTSSEKIRFSYWRQMSMEKILEKMFFIPKHNHMLIYKILLQDYEIFLALQYPISIHQKKKKLMKIYMYIYIFREIS